MYASAGMSVFSDICAGCHGALGTGGNGGPDLTAIPSAKDKAAVVKQVTNGGGGMPAFKGQLTDQQIQDVATYVTSEITNNSPGSSEGGRGSGRARRPRVRNRIARWPARDERE